MGHYSRSGQQAAEHMVDALEVRVFFQETLRLERIGDFGNQAAAHATHISQCREHPDRRDSKGDNTQQFNCVTGTAPREKVLGRRLLGGKHAFGAANPFDYEAQRHLDEVLVQLRAAHALRKHDLADFTEQAGAEGKRRPDDALRNR